MSTSFEFETFTKRHTRTTTLALATLQKRGTLGLNRVAYESLGSPEAVELLFDKKNEVIGLRPVEITQPHAYPIRKQINSDSFLVALQAFSGHYGLKYGDARRIITSVHDGVLIIDLKLPTSEISETNSEDTE